MFLLRVVAVWFLLMCTEVAQGTLRALYLAPLTGDLRSRQIGTGTGTALFLIVVCRMAGWLRAESPRRKLLAGSMWVLLTITFELGVGQYFRSWDDLLRDYDLTRGGLLPLGLAVLALSPWIAARLRRQGHPAR